MNNAKKVSLLLLVFIVGLSLFAICACNDATKPQECSHSMQPHNATEPTCTSNGNSEYWQCTKCNKLFADEQGKTEITPESTVVAAKGHAEVAIPAVEPTCTELGLTEGKKCTVCNTVLVEQQQVAAKGHTWGSWTATTAATCTAEGNEERTCSACSQKESHTTEKLHHSAVVIPAVAPTCTESGLTEGKKCTVCNTVLVEQQQVAAKGHTWSEWTTTTAATCTAEGNEERTCSACSQKESHTTEKLHHSAVVIPAVAPTCTADGNIQYWQCSECKKCFADQQCKTEISLENTIEAAKGHTWGGWTAKTAATCTSEGSEERTCSACNQKEMRSTEKLPHSEVAILAVAPTCTKTGLTEGTKCSVCNKILVAQQQIAAKGHTWGSWTTKSAATCTKEGEKVRTCSVCRAQQSQTIAKTPHNYVNDICTLCGDNRGGATNLSAVFQQYADYDNWNFRVTYVMTDSYGEYFYDDVLQFDGENFTMKYTDIDGATYTDVFVYDTAKAQYAYYFDNGDGTYSCYYSQDNVAEFEECCGYIDYIELSTLNNFQFSANGDHFSAKNPSATGNEILGEWEACAWTSVDIYVSNGKISKIVALQNDTSADYAGTYTLTLTFDNYGAITVKAPTSSGNEGGGSGSGDGGGSGNEPGGGEGVTLGWNNNPTCVGDAVGLQQQMINNEYSIGLPSVGSYDCLVVPVKFSDTTVTAADLENLNIAFNGTSEQTGWESVSTYYQKSSAGLLNLHFDILGYNIGIQNQPYVSTKSSAYYGNLKDSYGSANGDQTLLCEILEYLAAQSIDLSHYDSNSDGVIDAIYVIYSCEIDYNSTDSLWWAFVYEYEDYNATFQNLYADYYLFAGMDFMLEDVRGGNIQSGEIAGLKINSSTYIHETGHLLGLDDYYDYDTEQGGNRGLGGADMMDATVGDHNAYSKIMMGWLTPKKVTSTTTFTLNISDADLTNNCALISLDNTNSEFGEYLLIDLYTSAGINRLHAGLSNSLLYEGASFGARIFHVSSSCNNPYQDDGYGSFTDNNNSVSSVPLLMLVEADGWTSSSATDNGLWASENDLWQTGGSLQQTYPGYSDHANRPIGFDIFFNEVTSTTVTVTISFN